MLLHICLGYVEIIISSATKNKHISVCQSVSRKLAISRRISLQTMFGFVFVQGSLQYLILSNIARWSFYLTVEIMFYEKLKMLVVIATSKNHLFWCTWRNIYIPTFSLHLSLNLILKWHDVEVFRVLHDVADLE